MNSPPLNVASPSNTHVADITQPFVNADPALVGDVEAAIRRIQNGAIIESPEMPFRMTPGQKRLLEQCNCPAEFIVGCETEARFEALMETYVNAPTPLQKEYLAKHGINPDNCRHKDVASEIIGRIKEEKPMTPGQIRNLERLKGRYGSSFVIPENLTEARASRFIMEMQRSAPVTYKQHQALERHGIPIHKIPDTAREASILLSA